jgi:DNA-binding CsgD family transcriptional regulator
MDAEWTPRQREVLDLIAGGYTNREIGERLGISLDGAKWHVAEIISKLRVSSRDEVAEYWIGQRRRRWTGNLPRPAAATIAWTAAAAGTLVVGMMVLLAGLSLRSDDSGHGGEGEEPEAGAAIEPGTFTGTGPMTIPRSIHAGEVLEDGRVAIIGGNQIAGRGNLSPLVALTEIYDPASGTFSPARDLNEARQTMSAITLSDGRVLVVGGVADQGDPRTAEVFEPGTRSWSLTGALSIQRLRPAVGLLQGGRVLVAGGVEDETSTEIYDPASGRFEPGPEMLHPRRSPRWVTLPDGSLLVVSDGTAERYDPLAGRFVMVNDSGSLPEVPALLPDGRVLLTGGKDLALARTAPTPSPGAGHGRTIPAIRTAVILDVGSGTVHMVGQMEQARMMHEALALPDGRVLVAGGVQDSLFSGPGPLRSAEIFDPRTETFSQIAEMSDGRVWFTMHLLRGGQVLIVGASGVPHERAAELFWP